MLILCVFFLTMLATRASCECKTTGCATPATDCDTCLDVIPHDVFDMSAASTVYKCASGRCTVDETELLPGETSACDAGSNLCCLPSDQSVAFGKCSLKRCKQPLAISATAPCNPLGYCEYTSTNTRTSCCSINADCPPYSIDTVVVGSLQEQCEEPQCDANGTCLYANRLNCCVSDTDCPAVGGLCTKNICEPDPTRPGRKTCVPRVDANCNCAGNDANCNDLNFCTRDRCVSNQCQTTSDIVGSGCCSNDASAPAQCGGDVCITVLGCADTPVFDAGRSLTYVPTFQCTVEDAAVDGCCQASPDCTALASNSECILPTCNLLDNLCELNSAGYVPSASTVRLPCCHADTDCQPFDVGSGTSAPADWRCSWLQCSDGVSLTNPVVDAFKCVNRTIAGCTVGAGAAGIFPALSIAVQSGSIECAWTCGNLDQNTINYNVRIENPSAGNTPLYNYYVELLGDNAIATNTIESITLSTVSFSPTNRQLPIGLFAVQGAPVITAGLFVQRFSLTSDFPLYPEDTLTVSGQLVFNDNAVFSSITLRARIVPYDVCSAFFLLAPFPGCMVSSDLGDIIEQPAQTSLAQTVEFLNNPCSTICPPLSTPPPSPAAPTPPPPAGVVGAIVQLSLTLDGGCDWDCDSKVDNTKHRLRFLFTESNPSPTTAAIRFTRMQFNVVGNGGTFSASQILSSLVPPCRSNQFGPCGPLLLPPTYSTDASPGGAPTTLGPLDTNSILVQFFLTSSLTSPPGLTSITFTAIGIAEQTLCTQTLVLSGDCTQGEVNGAVAKDISRQSTVTVQIGSQCGEICDLPSADPHALALSVSQSLECDWNCDGDPDQRNLLRVTANIANLEPPDDFGFVIKNYLAFVATRNPDTDIFDYEAGSFTAFNFDRTLFVQEDYDGFPSPRANVQFSPNSGAFDFIDLSPGESGSIQFEFKVTGERFVVPGTTSLRFGLILAANILCTVLEVEKGNCPAVSFAKDPGETGLVTSLSSGGTAFAILGTYGGDCSIPCAAERPPPGQIGGTVWNDEDMDGILGGTESVFRNVRISLFLSSDDSSFASTLSGSDGRYLFETVPAQDFYLQVNSATVPNGYEITLFRAASNELFDNFFDDTLTTNPFQLSTYGGSFTNALLPLANAGFFRTPPCVPVAPPAGNPPSGLLLRLDPSLGTNPRCNGCVELLPLNDCQGALCTNVLSHNALELQYTLSNFGLFELGAGSVSVRLHPLDTAEFLCGSAQFANLENVHVLRTRDAILGGSYAREAEVEIGWRQLPVGQDVATFRVRFPYCADEIAPRFNVTARVFGDACVDLITRWRRCEPSIDVRACYTETVIDVSSLACPGCPPGPAPTPTAPPLSASTNLTVTQLLLTGPPVCVNNAAFDLLSCPDPAEAILQCTGSDRRQQYVAGVQLTNPSTTTASESGTLRLIYKRNMPLTRLVCHSPTRLPVGVTIATTDDALIEPKIIDVDESAADECIDLLLGFRSLPPLGSITVQFIYFECFDAGTTTFNQTLTTQLRTSACFDTSSCAAPNTLAIPETGIEVPTCVPIDKEDLITNAGAGAISAPMSDGSTTVIVIVAAVVLLVAVGICCCCWLLPPSASDRRRRSEPIMRATRQPVANFQRTVRVAQQQEERPVRRRTSDAQR